MNELSIQLLLRAVTFAADKHKNQLRKNAGGTPYINHALAVAELLARDDPPKDWPLARRQEYFDWAKSVVDRLHGVNEPMEAAFDEFYIASRKRPPWFRTTTSHWLNRPR